MAPTAGQPAGCSRAKRTAEQDHHLYLYEIVISKQPIGPLGSEK
jgi:hypothetical protein